MMELQQYVDRENCSTRYMSHLVNWRKTLQKVVQSATETLCCNLGTTVKHATPDAAMTMYDLILRPVGTK